MAMPLQDVSIDARKCVPKMEISLRIAHRRELQVRIRLATALLALIAKLLPNCEVAVTIHEPDSPSRPIE